MRFFTTCLLLFCFQSFVVCTLDDGAVIFAQKTEVPNKQLTVITKNVPTETVAALAFEWVDINHQHLTDQVFPALMTAKLSFNASIKLNTIKVFSTYVNYSYHFIFSCLYPKHNFW